MVFLGGRLRVPTRRCDLVVPTDWGWGSSNETPKLKAPREPTVRYLQISGNPLSAVISSSKQDCQHPTDMQTIVYTKSKQQAVGSISAAMESVLENSPNDGEVIPA